MGLIRRQPKQPAASEWIQPAQLLSQLGQSGPGGQAGTSGPPMGPPVPARLRPMSAAGHGDWLRGSLQLSPGSLLWTPDSGVGADPIELATAVMAPADGRGNVAELQAPAGWFQLELDPDLFEMSQQLVIEAAGP